MSDTQTMSLTAFGREPLDGAIALFAQEEWLTYTADPDRTLRALTAPGCTTVLAVDGDEVVGLAQVQSDGEIQAHLSALIVAPVARGRGLGRALLREALERAGGIRMDLISHSGGYYLALGARPIPGFRVTPESLG